MAGTKKSAMLTLHERLCQVFIKVLDSYIEQLDRDKAEGGTGEVCMDLEGEMVNELAKVAINPAMLAAVSKFLKDNEIKYLEEAAGESDKLKERLASMKNRKVVSLSELQVADG